MGERAEERYRMGEEKGIKTGRGRSANEAKKGQRYTSRRRPVEKGYPYVS